MNICIITQRYPYKDNMEFVFVKKLVDEWAKMGHRCVVITDFSWITYLRKRIDYKPNFYVDEVTSGKIVEVYNPRILTTKLHLNGIDFDLWLSEKAIYRQIKQIGIHFDFIYCHFFKSSFKVFRYAKQNNIPLFVASGESDIRKLGGLEKPYTSFNIDEYRSFVKGIISVSSKNKEDAANYGLIEREKCIVFPNGTDLTVFRKLDRRECRVKLNFPQDTFIISCVGYFCERKGQNRLLEAVRKLGKSNIKIIFLGKAAKVESFSLEGDEILFKGAINNKDIPTYLCASDIFCLPTLAEGCCNAIIEALACGLPVVSSNLQFNWDVLNQHNSILIDPNNIDEIASAINTLQDDCSLRQSMSETALISAQNLSVSKRAMFILNFIKDRIN